jgi:hypothetical protein
MKNVYRMLEMIAKKMQTQHEDVLQSLQVVQKQSVHVQNLLEIELLQSLSGCRKTSADTFSKQCVLQSSCRAPAVAWMTCRAPAVRLPESLWTCCRAWSPGDRWSNPQEQNLQPEKICGDGSPNGEAEMVLQMAM